MGSFIVIWLIFCTQNYSHFLANSLTNRPLSRENQEIGVRQAYQFKWMMVYWDTRSIAGGIKIFIGFRSQRKKEEEIRIISRDHYCYANLPALHWNIRHRKRLCGDHLRGSFVNSSFLRPFSGNYFFWLDNVVSQIVVPSFPSSLWTAASLFYSRTSSCWSAGTLCRNQKRTGYPKGRKSALFWPSTAGDSCLFSCSKNCNVIIFINKRTVCKGGKWSLLLSIHNFTQGLVPC